MSLTFDIGSLYRLNALNSAGLEKDYMFSAGNFSNKITTPSGDDEFEILEIPNKSILLFCKSYKIKYKGMEDQAYVFLCKEGLAIFTSFADEDFYKWFTKIC